MAKKAPPEVNMPLWRGRQITDPTHAHDLEQRAAIHEFETKVPKEAAEDMAWKDYAKTQHQKAAAKHWSGMLAGKATGDHAESVKHATMYSQHLQKLGLNPNGRIPPEIEQHLDTNKDEPFYRFQPHPADGFLFSQVKPERKPADTVKP